MPLPKRRILSWRRLTPIVSIVGALATACGSDPEVCTPRADRPRAVSQFTACGTTVDVVSSEPPSFDVASIAHERVVPVPLDPEADGLEHWVHADSNSLRVISNDGATFVGGVLLPALGRRVEMLETLAVVGTHEGLALVDLVRSDEPDLVAVWRPNDAGSRVSFAGIAHGRVVLSTPGGISLVDVSRPGAPAEVSCVLSREDVGWFHTVVEGLLVAAEQSPSGSGEAGVVSVYALSEQGRADLLGTLPAHWELEPLVVPGRLLVPRLEGSRFGWTLYTLHPDGPPELLTEVSRFETTWWVAGQLAFSDKRAIPPEALDLATGRLLAVEPVDEQGCAFRLVDLDSDEPADDHTDPTIVAPWTTPGVRYPAGSASRFVCASRDPLSPRHDAVVTAPDGGRIAFAFDDGQIRVADTSGVIGDLPIDGLPLHWTADGIIAHVFGDYDEPERLVWVDPDPTRALETTPVAGDVFPLQPWGSTAALDDRLWILIQDWERRYDATTGPASFNAVLRGTELVWTSRDEPTLHAVDLGGAGPFVSIYPVGDHLVLTPDHGTALVLDASGREVGRISDANDCCERLTERTRGTDRQATSSALGVFTTVDGVLTWMDVATGRGRRYVHGCSELRPLAADARNVYVASGRELRAVRPVVFNDDTFGFEVVARSSLAQFPNAVLAPPSSNASTLFVVAPMLLELTAP